MTTPRQRRFLFAQVGWMLAGIAALASAGALTLEYAFVVGFVGLVVVTALTTPVNATVRWRARLRWPLLVGGLVFAVLVGLRSVAKFFGTL
ncbi:hypothetical protein [Haloarcula laminariae]|uniref:hypothetical protein n=1 Tax=Haloarcula laminariae TaxID=2961577 RepID=UPI0021C6DE31|nr:MULTISPECIES: hypothetical protein [Halomicroarcula]